MTQMMQQRGLKRKSESEYIYIRKSKTSEKDVDYNTVCKNSVNGCLPFLTGVDWNEKVSVSAVSITTDTDSYLIGMGRYFFVQIP